MSLAILVNCFHSYFHSFFFFGFIYSQFHFRVILICGHEDHFPAVLCVVLTMFHVSFFSFPFSICYCCVLSVVCRASSGCICLYVFACVDICTHHLAWLFSSTTTYHVASSVGIALLRNKF